MVQFNQKNMDESSKLFQYITETYIELIIRVIKNIYINNTPCPSEKLGTIEQVKPQVYVMG